MKLGFAILGYAGIIGFLISILIFSYATAEASGIEDFYNGYVILDDFRGSAVGGVDPFPLNNVNISGVTDYYLDVSLTYPNYPRQIASSTVSYQDYIDENLKFYIMYASEAGTPQFTYSRNTSSGSGSGGFNFTSCSVGNEVQSNVFFCMLSATTSANLIFGGTATSTLSDYFGITGNATCTTNCQKPIGFVWSDIDVTSQVLSLTSYSDGITLLSSLISSCDNCTVNTPDGIYTSPDYTTRFLDLDITSTGNNVTLDADYYINPADLSTTDTSRNIELIRFCIANEEDTPTYTCNSVTSTTTGTTSTAYEYENLDDGQYDVLITFSNYEATFTNVFPFADTYIYSNFTIASGTVTQTGDVGIGLVGNTNNLGSYWRNIFDFDGQLFTRHPFAWVEDFLLLLIDKMTTEPSAEDTELPLVTLELNPMSGEENMFANDLGSYELELFSESTITSALGENNVTLIRSVIGYALILGFMFYLWRRITYLFRSNDTTA